MRLVPAESSDSNARYAVQLDDGLQVEAVAYRGHTLCVSSQVGCAVGCPFCASGRFGLARQLSTQELVDQVLAARDLGHALERVTISGVGEPLHNHAQVAPFIAWCRRERMAPSVTTTGGPLRHLREWFGLPHNGLTISVHAGTEPTRARLVPGAPGLDALFDVLRGELPRTTKSRRRKIALAYLLLEGTNDTDDEVDAFVRRASGLGAAIHLYALNAVPGLSASAAPRLRYEQVYRRMRDAGLTVRMSSQARVERNGGCGTLLATTAAAGPGCPAGGAGRSSCVSADAGARSWPAGP